MGLVHAATGIFRDATGYSLKPVIVPINNPGGITPPLDIFSTLNPVKVLLNTGNLQCHIASDYKDALFRSVNMLSGNSACYIEWTYNNMLVDNRSIAFNVDIKQSSVAYPNDGLFEIRAVIHQVDAGGNIIGSSDPITLSGYASKNSKNPTFVQGKTKYEANIDVAQINFNGGKVDLGPGKCNYILTKPFAEFMAQRTTFSDNVCLIEFDHIPEGLVQGTQCSSFDTA